MRKKGLAILCVSALLAACEPPTEGDSTQVTGRDLAEEGYETLAEGTTYEPGCLPRHDDRLIRTTAAWEAYWGQVHANPVPPLPSVDFAQQSVLATCGYRPDPGHSSTIEGVQPVEGQPGAVTVSVTDTEPGEGCFYPTVITYGHHAVRVEAVIGSAEFVHTAMQGQACGG